MPTPIPVTQPDLYAHGAEMRIRNRPEDGAPSMVIVVDMRSNDADDLLVQKKADRIEIEYDPDDPDAQAVYAALQTLVVKCLSARYGAA